MENVCDFFYGFGFLENTKIKIFHKSFRIFCWGGCIKINADMGSLIQLDRH